MDTNLGTERALDKELKERTELVFFVGGIYKCTINDTRNGQYCQFHLVFLLELPSQVDEEKFKAIPLWIAPSRNNHIEFDQHRLPTR